MKLLAHIIIMGKDEEVKERNLPYKNKDDNLNQEREADCPESVFGELSMLLRSVGNTFKTHNNQFYVAPSPDEINFLASYLLDILSFFRLFLEYYL